jgi:hypothetical protein
MRDVVIGVGLAAWLFLPSVGHFYADDWHPSGLAIRAVGLGVLMIGALFDASCDNEPCPGELIGVVGALTAVTGRSSISPPRVALRTTTTDPAASRSRRSG